MQGGTELPWLSPILDFLPDMSITGEKKMAQEGTILCINTHVEQVSLKEIFGRVNPWPWFVLPVRVGGCFCQVCAEPDILSRPMGMAQAALRVLRLQKGQKPD